MELPFSLDSLYQSQQFYSLINFLAEDRPSYPESPDRMAMQDAVWAVTNARKLAAAGFCDMLTLWHYEACVAAWTGRQNGSGVLMEI